MTRPTVALASHRWARPLRTRTGLGRYQVGLTCALVARDRHAHALLAPFEPGAPDPAWAGVPVVRLGGDRRVLQAGWTLAGRPRLPSTLDVDAVHVLDATLAVPSGPPVVHTIHDLFPLVHPSWTAPRGRLLFRAVARSISRAAAVVVPSAAVADEVTARLGIPPSRVTVVPEGVDDRFRHPAGPPPDVAGRRLEPDGYWLALGRPTRRKNLEVAVAALARAGGQRPLVVAGPHGPETERLRRTAHRLGVAHRVLMAGYVPDAELPALVAGARALLHPSRAEGFGLPPLEAMAAGTAVVVAPCRAVREVVGAAALTCDPDDVDAWSDALDVLEDDRRVAELADAGRHRAHAYTWDATAAATEDVVAGCL